MATARTRTKPTVRDITVDDIERDWTLVGYHRYGRWCPAVQVQGDGWAIRVLTGTITRRGTTTDTYDYFRLDSTGLITESPRGYAKDYTRRARVVDIAEQAAAWKEPRT